MLKIALQEDFHVLARVSQLIDLIKSSIKTKKKFQSR